MIQNLSQLKRAIHNNSRLEIVGHWRKDFVGQVRQITHSSSSAFYSLPLGLSSEEKRHLNEGKGYIMWWGKASAWKFENGVCSVYQSGLPHTENNLIMAFRVLTEEMEAA